jgi:hypothetical protein
MAAMTDIQDDLGRPIVVGSRVFVPAMPEHPWEARTGWVVKIVDEDLEQRPEVHVRFDDMTSDAFTASATYPTLEYVCDELRVHPRPAGRDLSSTNVEAAAALAGVVPRWQFPPPALATPAEIAEYEEVNRA